MRPLAGALVLAALQPAVAAQGKGGHQDWPFGVDGNGGAASMLDKRDLFNLGPLGAKAWDADRPEPTGQGSGRREIKGGGNDGKDDGPHRLVTKALFGGGPAQRAGLALGDIILGVDDQTFAGGCLLPLANAITRAESGDGKLLLQIERGGSPKTLTLKLAKIGKHAAEPEAGKMRQQLLGAACDWLADRQQGGGFAETLGGSNGAVVMTCLAGLAWIGEGSSLKRGRHKANLKSAVDFVLRELGGKSAVGGDANWDQSTWGYAHAAIFLGELQLCGKSKAISADLQRIATTLCKRQELTGGYGHGPGGKNALGYIELNILAAYVVSGLGVAQRAGCTVDAAIVDKLLGYTRESAGDDGGVGYATGPGQKGMGNIGRTAGTWLGARALGRGEDPFVARMQGYVQRHIADMMGGHASLQQHILLGGLAAAALDAETRAAYWDGGLRRDLTLARAPDGSFQSRPWHETLSMGSNTDVTMGEVWTTASWAIVLGAHRSDKKAALVGWLGAR
ncbi:MAG: PDZ domain-containing protein [Planctomycetes bacterium]|nr:PDZ domain-containing protein [Planctomycetota bacterium]